MAPLLFGGARETATAGSEGSQMAVQFDKVCQALYVSGVAFGEQRTKRYADRRRAEGYASELRQVSRKLTQEQQAHQFTRDLNEEQNGNRVSQQY
jgi:hypothetical protein